MKRDISLVPEVPVGIDVDAVLHINNSPVPEVSARSSGSNLKGEQHQALTAQLGHQMRLNGSHNAVVVPVH